MVIQLKDSHGQRSFVTKEELVRLLLPDLLGGDPGPAAAATDAEKARARHQAEALAGQFLQVSGVRQFVNPDGTVSDFDEFGEPIDPCVDPFENRTK